MSRSKHKKLYYVPGLISLILVPLLFAYFGNKEVQKLDLRAIEINSWHPDLEPTFPFPKRNYKKLVLSGDNAHDIVSIDKAKVYIKQMYEKNDTINGIRLELQKSVSYGTVVGLINFFKEDSITAFAIYNSNIWVLKQPEPKPGTKTEFIMVCGNSDLDITFNSTDQFSTTESMSLWFKDNVTSIQKLWPAIALLFILISVTILQLISHFKPTID